MVFFDAANFNNGSEGKVWAILAIILDLPPSIRQAFLNISSILYWIGYVYESFSKVFEYHLKELQDILVNGIFIQNLKTKVTINIHILIGDAQARPKIAFSTQYNGGNGCLHCMNAGYRKKGSLSRYYLYEPNTELRTKDIYLKQAEVASELKKSIEGIRGKSYFTKYCDFPDDIVIDYMHLLGFMEQLFNLYFDSKNHKKDFYLGIFLNYSYRNLLF